MSTLSPSHSPTPRSWLFLAGFLVLVLAAGTLIGVNNLPGPWYESLEKPPFNPPNWIFGPVWTTLYILIAIAGWRVFMARPRSLAMGFWVVQMLLNWAWSPVWFTLQMPWGAFAIIVPMLAAIIGFIVTARRFDPLAAWLFVPYAAWVSFASLLNLWIAVVN